MGTLDTWPILHTNTVVSYLVSEDSGEEELKWAKALLDSRGQTEKDLFPLKTNECAMRLFLGTSNCPLAHLVTATQEFEKKRNNEVDQRVFYISNRWGTIQSPVLIPSLKAIAFIAAKELNIGTPSIQVWSLTNDKRIWASSLSKDSEWFSASLTGVQGNQLVCKPPNLRARYFELATGEASPNPENASLIPLDSPRIVWRGNVIHYEDFDSGISGQYQIDTYERLLHYSFARGILVYLVFDDTIPFLNVVDCSQGRKLYSVNYREIGLDSGAWRKICADPRQPAQVYLGSDRGYVAKFDCASKTLTHFTTGVTKREGILSEKHPLGSHPTEVENLMIDGNLLVSVSLKHDNENYNSNTLGKIIVWNVKTGQSIDEHELYSSPRLAWFKNGFLAYHTDNCKEMTVINLLSPIKAYSEHSIL